MSPKALNTVCVRYCDNTKTNQLIDFFPTWEQQKQAVNTSDTLSGFKFIKQITHPPVSEQHRHSFAVVFLST